SLSEPVRCHIDVGSIQRCDSWAAEQLESANEIGAQNLDCACNTCIASRSQPVGVCTSDHDGSSTQTERFDNIAATADAAIEEDLDAIAYARHNFRQDLQRRRNTVELSATMIRNDQRIRSLVHCAEGILSRVDTFYHYRPVPGCANPLEVLPSDNGLFERRSD